jgi:hypothetical protein
MPPAVTEASMDNGIGIAGVTVAAGSDRSAR